jgi:hypothetical protein
MKYLIVSAALCASPAAAMDDLEAMSLAVSLGSVIASEETCGLNYDQAAIADFIRSSVPADRMDFASQMNLQVMGAGAMLTTMTQSQKTAHCAAIDQTARHFGFQK